MYQVRAGSRLLLYHYLGPLPLLITEPVLMPLSYIISDEMVKIQQRLRALDTGKKK